MKTKLATPVLIACAFFLATLSGVGLYQHMFDIPRMLSSPAALVEAGNNDAGQAQTFWIPLHAMTLISLVLSLVFNRKNPGRKKLLLAAAIGYVYISVVSIFFAKHLFTFDEITDAAEFSDRTHRWILLSWHRVVIMLATTVLLMIAVSRPQIPQKAT